MMKVVIFYHSKKMSWLTAIEKCFKRHGIAPELSNYSNPVDCDLAVFWSHRPKHIIKKQQETSRDYLVMERGFVGDRKRFTSLGFNGLNGRADFVVDNMPGDRWNTYFGNMKEWHDGKYYLLTAQCQGDASVEDINYKAWVTNIANRLLEFGPVVFRPHPIEIERKCDYSIFGTTTSTNPDIEDDLKGAKAAVMFNSNSGVNAIISGTPVIAFDKDSMVYDLSTHNLGELIYPDREQWAYDLAYKQWTVDEIESGEPWEYLKEKYNVMA